MQREDTNLTLDEEGLDAVKGFLKRIVNGENETHQEKQQTDIWEPPIDNEVK